MGTAYWQDYWAAGGKGDQVITAGAQRDALARHWREVFAAGADRPSPIVLDIASGDGAAIKFARERDRANALSDALLIALDASPSAVRSATHNVANAVGAAADAARLPLADDSADIVVSQFGLEYAGESAFAEAARVMKPDARFSSISHYKGGRIEAECAENERVLDAVAQSQVIPRAKESLVATYGARAPEPRPDLSVAATEAAFRDAARDLTAYLPDVQNFAAKRAIAFFLGELGALSARRLAYEPSEALQWLDHHAASFASYAERMRSMRAAALDEPTVQRIAGAFRDRGFTAFSAEPIRFEEGAPYGAWRIACA